MVLVFQIWTGRPHAQFYLKTTTLKTKCKWGWLLLPRRWLSKCECNFCLNTAAFRWLEYLDGKFTVKCVVSDNHSNSNVKHGREYVAGALALATNASLVVWIFSVSWCFDASALIFAREVRIVREESCYRPISKAYIANPNASTIMIIIHHMLWLILPVKLTTAYDELRFIFSNVFFNVRTLRLF